jgi:PHD/YefM family antitoxin component YafN of YafNO toxin-antitoxin module
MSKSFQVLDGGKAAAVFEKLHEQVARFHQRVIITTKGSKARCVLISAEELEALERALEILSATSHAQAMHEQVKQIALKLAKHSRISSSSLS